MQPLWKPSTVATARKRPTTVRVAYATKAAREVLRIFGVEEPPVDARAILSAFAHVLELELGTEGNRTVDASTVLCPEGYVTCLHNPDDPYRAAFTCAHEAGHIFLKHFVEFDVKALTRAEIAILDREANIFARELLMPEEWVRRHSNPPCLGDQLVRLKNMFYVSWDALIRRLEELGIQAESVSRAYLREYFIIRSFDLPLDLLPRNPLWDRQGSRVSTHWVSQGLKHR